MSQLHLIKLCVGVESVDELIAWQAEVLAKKRKKKLPPELEHITRQTPKRRDDLLKGGYLHWVIKGHIACRQRILDLQPVMKNEQPHCRIVLSPETERVTLRPCRAFQGWRYWTDNVVPLKGKCNTTLPDHLVADLDRFGVRG